MSYKELWEELTAKLPSNYTGENATMMAAQNADGSIGTDMYENGVVAVDERGTPNEAWYEVACSSLQYYLDVPEAWDGFRASEGGYCDDLDVAALLGMKI